MVIQNSESFDLNLLFQGHINGKIIQLEYSEFKNSKYFIAADDQGFIIIVGKYYKEPRSFYVGTPKIIELKKLLNGLMLVTPTSIAFINTVEANVYPYFCELNFLKDGPLIMHTAVEYRP